MSSFVYYPFVLELDNLGYRKFKFYNTLRVLSTTGNNKVKFSSKAKFLSNDVKI
jgi:hypothetical protein